MIDRITARVCKSYYQFGGADTSYLPIRDYQSLYSLIEHSSALCSGQIGCKSRFNVHDSDYCYNNYAF